MDGIYLSEDTFFTLVLAKQKLGLGISYACFQTKY